MTLLLFLAVLCIVYVVSFKDNFKKEDLEKVAPILLLGAVFIVVLVVLSSLV